MSPDPIDYNSIPGLSADHRQHLIEYDLHHAEEMKPLQETGVRVNSVNFACRSWAEHLMISSITEIRQGEFSPERGEEIAITGETGAVFFKPGEQPRVLRYSIPARGARLVDWDADGTTEFYASEAFFRSKAWLLDAHGNRLWEYEVDPPGGDVQGMTAGDIDGDGHAEFAVRHNGRGGVVLLDSRGQPRWRHDDANVWDIAIVPAHGTEPPRIVHSNSRYMLTVLDAGGNVVGSSRPIEHFTCFDVIPWPNRDSAPHLIAHAGGSFAVFDLSGHVHARLPCPGLPNTLGFGACRFAPQPSQADLIAVLMDYWVDERSVISVYNSEFALVFQEVFPFSVKSIAAVRLRNSEAEYLLLGTAGLHTPASAAAQATSGLSQDFGNVVMESAVWQLGQEEHLVEPITAI